MDSREKTPWTAAVAATVRAERAARGWTQDELVQRSGLSKSTIRRTESNDRVADISQIAKLADSFGVSLPEFFRMAEERLPL